MSQEITPLIFGSVAAIANFEDPSAFLSVNVSWSVSDESSLAAGAYFGLGMGPDFSNPLAPQLNSEFGTYPPALFAQLRSYF